MDFQLTDEQELLIESAREYASRYFTDEAVKQAYEVDHHISVEAAMAYREAGFMHLGLPEEVGGVPVDKLPTLEASEKPERLLLPPSVRFWERARMTIASCRVMVAVGLA